MGDTLVSARLASAKKAAGVGVLKGLGATTSDLINAAFDYVIEQGSLPSTEQQRRPNERSFRRFASSSTLDVPWPDALAPDGYKAILREGKQGDYERLA